MTWLEVQAQNIPSELRELPAVLWRAEPRPDGKPSKVPYRVADPTRRASSTDPSTWAMFADAIEAYSALVGIPDETRGPIAGVGCVLTGFDGITCIDLDRVLDEAGNLDVRARTIVERCDSWGEISPSGRGLHVFVRGSVPRALKGEQIEVYSSARYICLTGHQWPGTPSTLRDQQAYLDHLFQVDAAPARPAWTGPRVPPPDDLAGALLARLQAMAVEVGPIKRWADGYLVELSTCPWSDTHTTGRGGAAVMIHASGAFDFTCLHAHCAGRDWRAFRTLMGSRS